MEMGFYNIYKKDYHYCESSKYLRLRQQFEKVFLMVNASSSMKYKFSNSSQREERILYSVDNKNKASAQHMLLFLSSPEKQSCARGKKHHQPGSGTLSSISSKNKPACQSLQTAEYTKRKCNKSRALIYSL